MPAYTRYTPFTFGQKVKFSGCHQFFVFFSASTHPFKLRSISKDAEMFSLQNVVTRTFIQYHRSTDNAKIRVKMMIG